MKAKIELAGGRHDGKQLRVDLPCTFVTIPEVRTSMDISEGSGTLLYDRLHYKRTGRVTGAGLAVFELERSGG